MIIRFIHAGEDMHITVDTSKIMCLERDGPTIKLSDTADFENCIELVVDSRISIDEANLEKCCTIASQICDKIEYAMTNRDNNCLITIDMETGAVQR